MYSLSRIGLNLFCFIFVCLQPFCIASQHHLREKIEEVGTNDESLDDHVFREHAAGLLSRDDIIKGDKVSADHIHEVMFAVKLKNLAMLERILHDTSDPTSDRYGKHLTRERVEELTSNRGSQLKILSFLENVGAIIVSESLYGEYITASAPISLWERIFRTEFFIFHHISKNEMASKTVRAEHYSVPRGLHEHVESVFNTIQMPLVIWGKPITSRIQKLDKNSTIQNAALSGYVNPRLLSTFYEIDSNLGNFRSTQAVVESIGQYFNEKDLIQFQEYNSLPIRAVVSIIGGHIDDANVVCRSNFDDCNEASLDVQYLMAISQVSPTTHWYTDLGNFSGWLSSIPNTANPPLVISISYGASEETVSMSELDAFNVQAIKLGAMGITIVVSSGDDGASGYSARYNGALCGYRPLFPASSPYVTSVGATQGVESDTQEITCQSDLGGIITSGGGFSNYFPQPSWQSAVVKNYFSTVANSLSAPVSGFAATGRGYPDVALAGSKYFIVVGGQWFSVSGTSASAPVVAGMFSLINAARLAKNMPSLGFLNPTLYENYKSFANDITSGNNHCVADTLQCCAQGYYAALGWDPTTGLGSIKFSALKASLLKLGSVGKTVATPTFSKTSTATPTKVSTATPAKIPVRKVAKPKFFHSKPLDLEK